MIKCHLSFPPLSIFITTSKPIPLRSKCISRTTQGFRVNKTTLTLYVVLTPLTLRMAWLFFHGEIERNLGSALCDFLPGIIMPEAEMCYSVSHTWGPQVFLMKVFLVFSILKPTAFLFLPLLLCYFHHDLRDPIPTWLSLFTIECLEQMLPLSFLWLSFPEVGEPMVSWCLLHGCHHVSGIVMWHLMCLLT